MKYHDRVYYGSSLICVFHLLTQHPELTQVLKVGEPCQHQT